MITLNLKQGSKEWLSHRATHRNASDTPTVTGSSSYKKRSEFIKERATGIAPEVDAETQKIFNDGHRFESMARPLMEGIVGEDLYQSVGVDGEWSASFDGLNMLQDINAEHKTMNDAIRSCQCASELPAMYREQMEHQMMVSGAVKTLFMATKWKKAPGDSEEEGRIYAWSHDDDGNLVRYFLEEEKHFWYEPDIELRTKIIHAWEQFDKDVAAYVPEVKAAKPILTANPIDHLPALVIEVTGRVTHSNLNEFKSAATAVIGSIKTELVTDQDFVDATAAVKYLKDVEDSAKRAKQNALDQTDSIATLHRALDDVIKMAADVRKALDKKITDEKDRRKAELVTQANQALVTHIMDLNQRLGVAYMPRITAPFADVIKGLKSLDSMQEKINVALANAKVEANAVADLIDYNLKTLTADGADWRFLFPDLASVVTKAKEDFTATLMARVASHKEAEEKRLEKEREKIRAEEQAAAAAQIKEAAPAVMAQIDQAEQSGSLTAQESSGLRDVVAAIAADAVISQAKDCVTTIKLGEICAKLGLTVTADFLASLGVNPVATEKNAKLYDAAQFPAICRRIADHVMSLAFKKAA